MKLKPTHQKLEKIITENVKDVLSAKIDKTLATPLDNNVLLWADISETYSKAILNINNKKDELLKFVKNILEKHGLISSDEHIHRLHFQDVLRMQIGDEIKGFKGLYNNNKQACLYFKNDGKPEKMFVKSANGVNVYDCITDKIMNYSASDIEALFYYKYHPQAIHSKLRFNKDIYSGSFKEEAYSMIERLKNLFANPDKTFRAEQDTTLYRALQVQLTDADIQKLSTVGEVFTEKSFCSTTKSFDVAKRFSSKYPILEIEFPKNSKYVDLDKIFNIERRAWHEAEFLLDANSKFLVKGFDAEKNIIKVKYLGSE